MTEPGTSLPVYQLRVVPRGISPLIWRRLLVPVQAALQAGVPSRSPRRGPRGPAAGCEPLS